MKYLEILLIIPIILYISYIVINNVKINANNDNNKDKNKGNNKDKNKEVVEKFDTLNFDTVSKIDNTGPSFENILEERQDYKITGTPNIEMPILDAYLPYSSNIFNQDIKTVSDNTNEYTIINLYKSILQRQPTAKELDKNLYLFGTRELDEDKLKLQLLNSPEYRRLTKMQSNEVESGLIGAYAKEDLLEKLTNIYYQERNEMAPKKMVLPLRDVYIHLQYNEFLFRAMLQNDKYKLFEKEVVDEALLTKEKLLVYFNKYFDLIELKMKANDIRKDFLLKMKNEMGEVPEASKKSTYSPVDKKDTDISEQLSKIMRNSNDLFNKDDLAKLLEKGKYKSDLYMRIYDPIKYKQHYRGEPLFRPPICTTLGKQQKVSPVFTDSKMLFQGTDLKEAINDTQVGSIMPKFEYKEYQDINVV